MNTVNYEKHRVAHVAIFSLWASLYLILHSDSWCVVTWTPHSSVSTVPVTCFGLVALTVFPFKTLYLLFYLLGL